ncbi:Uncharacterized protein TCAP_07481 [Tolypocladium capitatum]|uniref:Chromo domain-containing protein n=1 Tax=Tolypocladium capitatum TaxID=45235 RepID=A0A2K3PWP4_9HYPO|nr:Uncharacterized protein TCAP_07481 [Tolypocladium capitatum]
MDRITLKKTYRWPSPSRGRSSQQPGVSWNFPFSSASPSPASSGSCDSVTSSESGSPCESSESISEPDLGKPAIVSGAPVIETTGPETEREGTPPGLVESPAPTTGSAMDADRVQTLFSEYEGSLEDKLSHANAAFQHLKMHCLQRFADNATLEADCPEPQQQTPSEAITACEQPQVTQPRRTQRRRTAAPCAAGTAQHRVQKKRASSSRSQEYEFLRLGEAREAPNGSIEYKVIWAPTWVTVDYLRGQRSFEEAEELVVKEFDRATWEREVRKSGYLGTDSETE